MNKRQSRVGLCIVEGCDKPIKATRLCDMHYARFRRNGSLYLNKDRKGIAVSDMYYLLDLERTVKSGLAHYWKQNRRGYTISIREAGTYHKNEAASIVESDFDNTTIKISELVVNRLIGDSRRLDI